MPRDALLMSRAPTLVSSDKAGGKDEGFGEDEVNLVVAQTGKSEAEARAALKAENGDLVNASESALPFDMTQAGYDAAAEKADKAVMRLS